MSIFSKSTETQSRTDPYAPARGGLDASIGFQDRLQDRGYYKGDMRADVRPEQWQGATDYLDAAQGYGDLGNYQYGQGADLSQGLDQSQGYYQDRMANGGAMTQNQDQYIDMAGNFANNPHLDGMIGAATNDMNRNYNENIMPSVAGAFQDNTNNSKYAQQWATQDRGLKSDVFDTSLMFRGDQWDKGMNYANQAAGRDDQYGMASANMLNNQGVFGLGQMERGQQNRMLPSQTAMEIGQYRQGLEQQGLDEARQRWDEPLNWNAGMQSSFMSPGQAFSSQYSKQTQSQSPVGGAIGIAAQLGAAYMTGGASLFAGAASSGVNGMVSGGSGGFSQTAGGGAIANQLPGAQGYQLAPQPGLWGR